MKTCSVPYYYNSKYIHVFLSKPTVMKGIGDFLDELNLETL